MKLDFNIDLFELLTADYSEAWGRIVEVIYDPASDPTLAILVFGILSLLVATVLLGAIMFVMSTGDDEDEYEDEEIDSDPHEVEGAAQPATTGSERVQLPARSSSGVVGLLIPIVIAAAVWFAVGYGTSGNEVCLGCHTKTPHIAEGMGTEQVSDAHESLGCVDCHEPGSAVGRYGMPTVTRAVHMLRGFGMISKDEYGTTTPAACLNCHETVTTTTIKDQARGVAVSHKEPLEAGARCVDCHPLRNGVVAPGPGGMAKCLRCHDGVKAKSDCESCHFKDIAVAASAPRSTESTAGRAIIGTPDCGGCHNVAKSCDPCHGIRLPHTPEFVRGGHARQAVENYWYGDGKQCTKCHTQERRPCGTCHQGKFWSHGKSWAEGHKPSDKGASSCIGCHSATEGMLPNRNFCIDVCHQDREEWRRTPR